ncbi:MAG: lytic murein transglycosylase [bacterium]
MILLIISATSLFATNRGVAECCQESGTFSKLERQNLVRLFDQPDYDKTIIRKIFFDPRLQKMPVVVHRNVDNKEVKRNYDEFLNRYSIHLANKFARKWRTLLARASRKFKVDREILVAILLVETGFGNVLGRYPIVSVYSSIIVENMRQQMQCAQIEMRGCLESTLVNRLKMKAQWAEKELRALIEIAESSDRNLFHFKGSYAGAFGIPQFLPSSYLKWGYDSDRNGSVNLFLLPDAIYSTANYLKAHGWSKGLHNESNRDVIWEYNHSRIYVDTVLKVAQRIQIPPVKLEKNMPSQEKPQITQNIKKQRTNNPS